MAVHRKPEPPRTLEDWRVWEDACIQTNRRDWLPGDSIRITLPEGWRDDWPGIRWTPLAEDHPFKGCDFCWRCLAEASGFAAGSAPHARDWGAVCFEASGDPDAEDGDPDSVTFDVEVTPDEIRRIAPEGLPICDPSRPALAGEAEHRVWWQAGASIVAEGDDRPDDFADTGTFFYDGPGAR